MTGPEYRSLFVTFPIEQLSGRGIVERSRKFPNEPSNKETFVGPSVVCESHN